MHNHNEELMQVFKHGAEVGGSFVIQHQTEETVAAILLAWTGEEILASDTMNIAILVYEESNRKHLLLLFRRRSLCFC